MPLINCEYIDGESPGVIRMREGQKKHSSDNFSNQWFKKKEEFP